MIHHHCESVRKSPLKKYCTGEEIQMAYKHGKIFIINNSENCKLKPTVKYHFTVISLAKNSNPANTMFGEGCEAKKTLLIANGSMN